MLWTSLHLPTLQQDALTPSQKTPIAITKKTNNKHLIVSCTKSATDHGITQLMTLNSAYSLCPALTVIEYDEEYQARLLQELGEWAMQFSSIVSLHPPDHVLIEIAGSRRLFESYQALMSLIQQELTQLDVNAHLGVAPTPLAANLLAHANNRIAITRLDRLADSIKDLPITLLDLDASIIEGLQRSGFHKIGKLLTISPASLTRRFGPACSKYLDCLLGKHPYPVTPLRCSELFERKLDLPVEVDDTNALQFATQRMTNELSAFLIARDHGVNHFHFILRHERHADTEIELRFLHPTSQAKHLHQVLSERLSQTTLPATVCGLNMLANSFCQIERGATDLFHKSRSQQKSLGETIDKLSSRLGQDALHSLLPVEDHRPEIAWKKTPPDNIESYSHNWPQRPLWLLDSPKLANFRLRKITEIERIETGWWDKTDVRRDYFIADDDDGIRYWVFRERDGSNALYIHGLFA